MNSVEAKSPIQESLDGNLVGGSLGGVNVLIGDGSVRFGKNTVNLLPWQALATIRGGEIIDANAF